MTRRDVYWIAGIWGALSVVAAIGATFFRDGDPATNDTLGYGILAVVVGAAATGFYVFARRRSLDRVDILCIAGIWGAVLGAAIVLGSPPLWGLIGALVTGSYLELRRRTEHPWEPPPGSRACPACAEPMPSGARRCQRCGSESTPWTFHDGAWWAWSDSAGWQWLDEESGFWTLPGDGAPAPPPDPASSPRLTGHIVVGPRER